MKKHFISAAAAALTLALGVSFLSSCAEVISFPDKATDPGVSLWEEQTPSDPADLLGIWYSDQVGTVFGFGDRGVLTAWSLVTGYDYEYSAIASGTYTYDGEKLTFTLGDETVSYDCCVKNGTLTLNDTVTLSRRIDEPTEHPSYEFPNFELLAATLPRPSADQLTGLTLSAADVRLSAIVSIKNTYFSDKEMTKLTNGTAQLGDIVNLDYVGKLDGETFSGGTASNVDLCVAPDTGYIPGFCEGIAGHSVGETFDVPVTFPASYGNAALAGKSVIFTMTLNAIYDTTLTDEMVDAYEDHDYTTLAEWQQAVYEELLAEEIWELIPALSEIIDTTDAYLCYYQEMLDYYHYYAYYYNLDFDLFLSYYVGATTEDLKTQSRSLVRNYLLAALTVRALEITPSEEWQAKFTADYLNPYLQNGYTEETARELISSGEGQNRFRAELLLKFASEHLLAQNTFIN